jgi:alanyl-tRNA synthetase
MGIEKSKITYIEDVWAMGDFSEFGPDLESFAYGLELVNSVFTEFAYSNGKISELKNKVVDVGWGFERLIWFASGEYTLYDAIFHNELDYLYKKLDFTPDKNAYSKVAGISGLIDLGEDKNGSKKELELVEKNGVDKDTYYKSIKPIQALYAIVDHTRTLLFAINDGALPSNVGGGYNLRILLRRIFNFIDTYDFKFDLMKLFELHAKDLEGLYPNLSESLEDISNIIKIERERYDEMKERSKNKVEQILKKHEEITSDTMRLLYESYGITSDFISMYAKKNGYDISIPDDYIDLIKGDFTEKKKKKKTFDIDVEGLPKTLKLFYDFDNMSDSKVLKVNKNLVVLDRTPFYAESGGQEADHGEMNGIRVLDVQSVGGVIVHVLAESPQFNENEYVRCIVDEDRRIRLMAHHTATHLVSAAARSVLGKHAWQEGAHKGEDKAHIDIAHYDKLNDQQIKEIESKANSYIFHGMKVSLHEMNRGDAESEFGFSIYQGHGTPSTKLRIITIKNLNGELIDAEACGGLHLINRESLIGIIKIVKSSRIHDGIDRIEFTAGPASLDYTRSIENSINHVSKIFGIDEDKIDEGVESKIRELKDLTDYSKSMENKIIRYESEMLSKENDKIIVKEFTDYRPEILRQIALDTVKRSDSKVVILYNHIGNAVISAGKESDVNAIEYIKDYSKKNKINFRGGGSASIAEGKFEFSDSEKDKV